MQDQNRDSQQAPSPRRKAGQRGFDAIFAFIARSLQQIATFIITILAAGFLLPAEYGIYTLAVVFITLIQTLTYTGFYQFIITSKKDDAAILATSFWMITGLSLLASLVLALCARPIAWMYDAPELEPVIYYMAAIQPVSSAGAWSSAVLLRRQRVRLHFGIMFLQNIASLIGGVALLWWWQSLYALVAFRYIRVLSGTFLYTAFMPERPALTFDRVLAQEATAFSGGLYGSRLLGFLARYGADLILGLMFSTAESGLYRFGNRVATGATDIVAQPMRSFALTQFGAANRADQDLAPVLERFAGTTMLLIGGVAVVIAVFAQDVVANFFNPAYGAAIVVTYALAARAFAAIGAELLEPVLSARHRTGVLMTYNLIWTMLTVGAVFAAAPFGLEALAWVQAGVALASTLAALVVIRRQGQTAIKGALRVMAISVALVASYAVVLWFAWGWLRPVIAHPGLALTAGLAMAAVLGLAMLAAGYKLRVFFLRAFSG